MKYYIGIDLGGTNLVAGLVNEAASLIDKEAVPTNTNSGAAGIIAAMKAVTDRLLDRNNLKLYEIEAIGIGVPGTANRETGMIEFANNLNVSYEPFLPMAKEAFCGKSVYFNNDANAAAWGEYLAGAAAEAKSFVAVTLGTGVGGGIILDGKIYEGVNFAAGELGHMVIMADGLPCNCGRTGCFEAYASATALIQQTKAAMKGDVFSLLWEQCAEDINKVEGKTLFDAVRRGDETAIKVLKQYIKYLAAGIINIINVFQPEIICIGGGISKAGDLLMGPIREIVARESYSRNSDKQTRIVTAKLYNDAGIIGAALLGSAIHSA